MHGRRTTAALLAAAFAGALVPASGVAAKLRVAANYRQPIGSVAVEPRGNDAVGLTVNPKDKSHIVSVNADFLEFECEYGVSFDGGKTWKGGQLRAPSQFGDNGTNACSPVGHGWSAMDQSVDFGKGDNVYTTFAAAEKIEDASPGQSALVAKSTNGGKSFGEATVAMPGGPSTSQGPEYRFPKLVAKGSNVYLVAYNRVRPPSPAAPIDQVVFSKSTDGGATWSDPVVASDPAENAIEPTQPVIGEDGALYVAYRRSGFESVVRIAKSTDGGATWSQTDVVPVVGYDSGTSKFSASTFPRLAADPGTGNVYIVYNQGPVDGGYPGQPTAADHFIHPDIDVLFVRSLDGGETWSSPTLINDTTSPDLTQTRHPNISVAPNGRIDIVWHDRRHSYKMQTCSNTHSPPSGFAPCEEARFGDTYYAFSTDEGQTWSPNRRITDRTMNNDVGSDFRFGVYWDFGPVSVPLGNNKVLFGWMDSRMGNFHNDNLDIFFGRLNLEARGDSPAKKIERAGVASLSAALSKFTYMGGLEARIESTFATKGKGDLVVVNRKDVARALAGGVLARANLGSVLLSNENGLPRSVKAEVERMTPTGIYVIGGEGRLGPGVIADLEDAVPADSPDTEEVEETPIQRIEGNNFEAAAAMALAMDRRSDEEKAASTPAFDAAIIANPARKDAVAAAGLAAHRRLPVLFVEQDAVPQETTDALNALNIDKTLIIGGTKSVGAAVEAALPAPTRLGSNKLYATSKAVVLESRARHMPTNIVYVADGAASMDAALLGHVVGRLGGLMLLAPNGSADRARATLGKLGLGSAVDRIVIARTTG